MNTINPIKEILALNDKVKNDPLFIAAEEKLLAVLYKKLHLVSDKTMTEAITAFCNETYPILEKYTKDQTEIALNFLAGRTPVFMSFKNAEEVVLEIDWNDDRCMPLWDTFDEGKQFVWISAYYNYVVKMTFQHYLDFALNYALRI